MSEVAIYKSKQLEKKINNLKARISAIQTKIKEFDDSVCPVCLGEIEENPTMVDCCGAIFCFNCLAMASKGKGKCLFCLKKIGKQSIHILASNKNTTGAKELPEKLNALVEIITKKSKNEEKRKFLVFANYVETFNIIKKKLEADKITYEILKGTDKMIAKAIDNFKKGKTSVLMLNAENFGAGLNLQDATDVIIYHRFTKETEEQVIGRAQRLGRKGKLNVYYLIHDNENNTFPETYNFDEVDYDNYLEGDD